jgi:hypothetical protein
MEGQMSQIEMSAEEQGLVKEILEGYLSDLRMEVADTDSQDFREGLKTKEELVKGLLKRF